MVLRKQSQASPTRFPIYSRCKQKYRGRSELNAELRRGAVVFGNPVRMPPCHGGATVGPKERSTSCAAGDERADESMDESRHAQEHAFSWVAFAFVAAFAFITLVGAGTLFSFLSGTGSDLPAHSAADRLKDGLLLSPALLPSCATVALVRGHFTLSKILLGAGVLATLMFTLGAMAAQVDTEHSTFQGSAVLYGFGLAFLIGLVTLALPFRGER